MNFIRRPFENNVFDAAVHAVLETVRVVFDRQLMKEEMYFLPEDEVMVQVNLKPTQAFAQLAFDFIGADRRGGRHILMSQKFRRPDGSGVPVDAFRTPVLDNSSVMEKRDPVADREAFLLIMRNVDRGNPVSPENLA